MKEAIITTGVVLVMSYAIIAAIIYGTDTSDQNECKKWANEAQQYPAYYITEWQKAQCDYWSTPINATVK